MSTQLERIEERIKKIQEELEAMGPMRPGSITRQYRVPEEKRRPFYQISYTHHMKSRTEYVRPENLAALRQEVANFKQFKKLTTRWVDLALKASQLRIRNINKKTRQAH